MEMSEKKKSPNNRYRFLLIIDTHLRNLLKQRALDESLSINKLIIKALTLYLTKDIEDESLMIAKLTEVQRQVEYIEKKIDLSQKKDMQWEQFLLTLQPELPVDSTTRNLKIKRSNERYINFLTQFRNRIKVIPSLFETIQGDLQEKKQPDTGKGNE
jgi:hypothetical protein